MAKQNQNSDQNNGNGGQSQNGGGDVIVNKPLRDLSTYSERGIKDKPTQK